MPEIRRHRRAGIAPMNAIVPDVPPMVVEMVNPIPAPIEREHLLENDDILENDVIEEDIERWAAEEMERARENEDGFIAQEPPPIIHQFNPFAPPVPINEAERERRRADQIRRAEEILRMEREINRPFGVNRGGRIRRVDNADIPANIAEEPIRLVKREVPMKKPMPRKKEYPPDGVLFRGRKFARALNYLEQNFYDDYGYSSLIGRYPDLEYIEKEKPINEKEECIVLISEVADYYATKECESAIKDFNLEDHNTEYQIAYKKHLKTIDSFKRNKNG